GVAAHDSRQQRSEALGILHHQGGSLSFQIACGLFHELQIFPSLGVYQGVKNTPVETILAVELGSLRDQSLDESELGGFWTQRLKDPMERRPCTGTVGKVGVGAGSEEVLG